MGNTILIDNANEIIEAAVEHVCVNNRRLRAQVARSRVNMLKWGFSNEQETCGRYQADHATPTSPFAAPMCSIVNLRMLFSTRFFGGFTIPWGP